jgi:hypothetical protein
MNTTFPLRAATWLVFTNCFTSSEKVLRRRARRGKIWSVSDFLNAGGIYTPMGHFVRLWRDLDANCGGLLTEILGSGLLIAECLRCKSGVNGLEFLFDTVA